MFIYLDKDSSKKHVYQQIYEAIKEKILTRDLQPNEKLPSKRELATTLKVSINTIMYAYEQLLAEGYIYTIERQGYYIENIMPFNVVNKEPLQLPEDLKEQPINKDDWLSLSHMKTNSSRFPFNHWTKYQNEAIKLFSKELSDFCETQGPLILRKTIAKLIKTTRGVHCAPEQIIIHATSQGLLEQFIKIIDSKSTFALENPGYARYYNLLLDHQINTQIIPLDEKGINIDYLNKTNSQFLITTPSHQFPTGIIMPISRRIELLHWAKTSENRYIIEDDYDSDFKYNTDNIPSLQSLDFNEKVIYMGTFSKTLLPGIRISYMVLPPELLRKYKQRYNQYIHPANILALYTLNQFIETGYYSKYVRKMNSIYEEIRRTLLKKLKDRFKKQIEIIDIPAGLHFLVKIKTNKSYEQIEKDVAKQKLELYTIKRFLISPDPFYLHNRYLVIGFANINLTDIDKAVERLYKAITL